jgi:hypothetical protein
MRVRDLAALVLCTPMAAGCYRYVPRQATAEDLRVSGEYRAELSDSGVVVVAPQVGPGVYRLDGRLAAATPSALTFAVTSTTSRRLNTDQLWAGERVVVERPLITNLLERRLSKGRTAAFSVLALGAVMGAYAAFQNIQGGGRGPGSEPPVTQ